MNFRVGTAGWIVPRQHLELFPASDAAKPPSHLERYAGTLRCVEVNSSFYKSHRTSTWKRWADHTPDDFRFAVKMPKAITHQAKLANCGGLLQTFLREVSVLEAKLGPVLIQLPPKLIFDHGAAHEFLTTLRELHQGPVVLEPRNTTWFNAAANRLLCDFEIARVAADPPKGSDLAARPGGWPGLQYWRLHGAPRTYYSDYDDSSLHNFVYRIAATIQRTQPEQLWVIFDNTALGHAAANAVSMQSLVDQTPPHCPLDTAAFFPQLPRSRSA